MITLENDQLVFSFPEVHEDARLAVTFRRTLRIPDDDRTYPLPPELGLMLHIDDFGDRMRTSDDDRTYPPPPPLGRCPLRHVDDFGDRVPQHWRPRGGVMLPMFQSEAMYIDLAGRIYPFAVKVAAGKINAVDGKPWANGIAAEPQNYVVTPPQRCLDGYCVEKGIIRQFVVMPLGAGYTVEEQVTGEAEHGGIQIIAYPMKRDLYEEYKELSRIRARIPRRAGRSGQFSAPDMGLAPGGRMRQHINKDKHGVEAWDQAHSSRCFVAIANSLAWRAITGEASPRLPPTPRHYAKRGLPWFDYYAEAASVEGAPAFKDLLSVAGLGKKKGEVPLPENDSADASVVVPIGPAKPGPRPVREATIE